MQKKTDKFLAVRGSQKSFDDLNSIFMAGVNRVNPYLLINECMELDHSLMTIKNGFDIKQIDLDQFENIIVVGAGKATAKMAKAVEEKLGTRIKQGVIAVKYGHTEPLQIIKTIEAGHPVPDENGLMAAHEIVKLVKRADEKSLVIGLISGGGSALIPYPIQTTEKNRSIKLTLAEKQSVTTSLLRCGATINEINCIRKHLSMIKGGRLAKLIFPAQSLNFILSDVVGDRLDCIASGPTWYDESTFSQVSEIIHKYNLRDQLPEHVLKLVELGLNGSLAETPKSNDPVFKKTSNILIGTNRIALEAAAAKASSLGFETEIISSQLIGEAREVAKVLCGIAKDTKKFKMAGGKPKCLITGGETTVTLKGNGKGGRSQEMALSFLSEISDDPNATKDIYFLSASTDGNDGPTDAAGAYASIDIVNTAKRLNLSIVNYLNNNDAYRFFDQTGHLLKTGPTNTNVCDIQLAIIFP